MYFLLYFSIFGCSLGPVSEGAVLAEQYCTEWNAIVTEVSDSKQFTRDIWTFTSTWETKPHSIAQKYADEPIKKFGFLFGYNYGIQDCKKD